jgi:hypothetical protein
MTKSAKGMGAALLALLLMLGGIGDALGAHECPHHDGTPADTHAGSPAAHQHGPSPDSEAHGPCTCIGRCNAGETPTLLWPDPGRYLSAASVPPLALSAPQPWLRSAIVPFSLPWSNAPPTL